MLSKEESETLQMQGANARALGRSRFDNPFCHTENLPAKTGEPIDTWSAKLEAWQIGWSIEDAIRSSGTVH